MTTTKLLREMRVASGLSVQAIAVAAGLHANTVDRCFTISPVPPVSMESMSAVERTLFKAIKANQQRNERLLAKLAGVEVVAEAVA